MPTSAPTERRPSPRLNPRPQPRPGRPASTAQRPARRSGRAGLPRVRRRGRRRRLLHAVRGGRRSPRDHFTEQPAPWVAAVCDRGIRHRRNEDAVALDAGAEPGSHAVLVVCDGVSSSTDSDVASLAAARAARDVLRALRRPGGIGTAATAGRGDREGTRGGRGRGQRRAVHRRHRRPARATRPRAPSSPRWWTAPLLVVGWVGDSRAYWLPETGEPQLLTVDDSFAAEQIAERRRPAPRPRAGRRPTRSPGGSASTPPTTPRARPRWTSDARDGCWSAPTGCGTTAPSRATCRAGGRSRAAPRARAARRWPAPWSTGPTPRAAGQHHRGPRRGLRHRAHRPTQPTVPRSPPPREETQPDGHVLS